MFTGKELVFCLESFLGDAGSESIAASGNMLFTRILNTFPASLRRKTNTARLVYLNNVPV